MKFLVTGSAGFVGSSIVDFLLSRGDEVSGIDNFSTGQREFVEPALKNKNYHFFEIDLLDFEKASEVLSSFKPEVVVHLAANADVRFGLNHPRKDLEQGTLVTFNVLEASRLAGVKKFCYASTGSVYGEPSVFPTPETCPFPVQTSLYAASKLAGEALIQAYAEGYEMKGYIFRFVSILGERYTHGHILDFARKLLENPHSISILGDGKQRKAYLNIKDCVRAMTHLIATCEEKINIYNLGPDEFIDVDQSLSLICKQMNVDPKRVYEGGKRGWVGDSPFIFLDCAKLKNTGWRAEHSLKNSISETLTYLLKNKWIFERR